MKQFKTKKFNNEASKVGLKDEVLLETLTNFLKLNRDEQIKFSLGAGLYKVRIATKEGRGKSAGSRTILAFKRDNGMYWLHLLKKKKKGNVTSSELKKLKHVADILFGLTDEQINKLITLGELCEVKNNV